MKHNDANGSPDNINFALNVNIYKRETTLRLNGRHKERFLFNWRVDRCWQVTALYLKWYFIMDI